MQSHWGNVFWPLHLTPYPPSSSFYYCRTHTVFPKDRSSHAYTVPFYYGTYSSYCLVYIQYICAYSKKTKRVGIFWPFRKKITNKCELKNAWGKAIIFIYSQDIINFERFSYFLKKGLENKSWSFPLAWLDQKSPLSSSSFSFLKRSVPLPPLFVLNLDLLLKILPSFLATVLQHV